MDAHLPNYRKAQNNQFTDLRVILTKYLYYWPFFLLGLLLSIAAAYAYMQIVNPVYDIDATILVKDEKKTPQEKPALQELEQSGSPKNAETEIQILSSKKLINQVVNDLQLWATYTIHAGFKTQDVYETTPFKFSLIKPLGELNGQTMDVFIKDKNTFEIKNIGGQSQNVAFNSALKNSFGTWTLKPTEFLDQYIGSTIRLTINDPEKVSNDYLKILDAHLLDKATPTIGLFITDVAPKRGKDFLNYLIKSYNEASAAEEKRTTKSTIDFIDNRLASLSGELSHAEKRVEGFSSSQGLTDIGTQSKAYIENVQSNGVKMNDVNVQLNTINGIEEYVNSNSNTENAPATIGINDPALNSSIEKLSQLQLKRAALLATTPESNPVFEPIDRQIKLTKSAIKETIRGIKTSLLGAKRELQSFNNKSESSIKNIPGQERQFGDMKRQQSIKENLYVYLLQKREELALSYASTAVDARIVDNANVGDVKWPKSSFVYAIAMLCGLGLPFFAIYFWQSLTNKITERRDIENALNIPILGELSYQKHDKNIVILNNVRTIVSEQFRALRTNLHYLHDNKKDKINDGLVSIKKASGRVTLFTSSVSGEGKSFVSSNLAASLAASGRKTVILEMDLRKPKISGIFNLSPEHLGISDILSSNILMDDIIQPSGIVPNLDVIGCGHIPHNPSELLEKDSLNDLIFKLRQRYDDVIIDSPPLHLVTDAMIIARLVDVSLYVIRQGHTGKAELDFIREVHEDEKLPNMSIVFNGIKKGKYGYGYNYDNSYYTTETRKPVFNVL